MADAHAHDRTRNVLLALIAVVLVAAALRATYFITMPLVFAFFITVLVWPLHDGLRRRLPERFEWAAVVATMLLIVAVLGGLLAGLWIAVYRVARERLEVYAQEGGARWEELAGWLEARGLPVPAEAGQDLLGPVLAWAQTTARSLTELLAGLVFVLFCVLLMLVEADRWRAKATTALSAGRSEALMDAVSATTRQVRTFIVVQAGISFLTALTTALWLWFMDVPFVVIWFIVTFVLDFVPNVGPILAGALASVVALVTLGLAGGVATALGVIIIQQVFGNYIHPAAHGPAPVRSPRSSCSWRWSSGPGCGAPAAPSSPCRTATSSRLRPRTGAAPAGAHAQPHGRRGGSTSRPRAATPRPVPRPPDAAQLSAARRAPSAKAADAAATSSTGRGPARVRCGTRRAARKLAGTLAAAEQDLLPRLDHVERVEPGGRDRPLLRAERAPGAAAQVAARLEDEVDAGQGVPERVEGPDRAGGPGRRERGAAHVLAGRGPAGRPARAAGRGAAAPAA
ncbi:MAG: AI-2E family transporter [Planctomycetota bacterium]|nr:AI-2E family transporter [Planctomycetota bacterium]